jgi:DNA-binding CsgD family transcriptional regulator
MTRPLAATERRVALLAAWGATNKQVADLLHLSPKAVEWHLARINQKLGVGSRAELSAPVGGQPSPGLSSAAPTEESR